jgi:uncharacterized protein (DUF362 family)
MAMLSWLVPSCLREGGAETGAGAGTQVSESPAPAGTAPTARVSLVRTADRGQGVRSTISLLQPGSFRGKKVILKPNFNTADPAPGSTHNDTLRSLVLNLQEMEASKVTLAERSGPPNTRNVMEAKGTLPLAQELGFDVINLQELGPEGWVHIAAKESHWKDGFRFARAYLEAESIVQTCCLKTHAYGGHFTLSLKNSVGLVPRTGYPYMGELHSSRYQRQMIAEINAAYAPDLIVLDGVEAFVDGGPDRGTRVEAGVMLAGTDRVAIDAVGVAILRLLGTTPEVSQGPIFAQDQIARAVELGLGVSSPEQIQLVTGDPESEAFAAKIRETLLQG